ncbi:MAG: hypothetical protein ACHP85_20100, partial [Burkholderiales bacterium]
RERAPAAAAAAGREDGEHGLARAPWEAESLDGATPTAPARERAERGGASDSFRHGGASDAFKR